MLERENIKYEALYGYRLERDKDYDPFVTSGAIINVPRSVYHDADRLLVENKLKEKEDPVKQRFSFVNKVDKYLFAIPVIRSVPLYGKLLGLLAFIGVLLFLWLFLQHDCGFLNPNEAINRFQVKSIHFQGTEMIPDTEYDYDLVVLDNTEQISFRWVPNEVTFPGFNSEHVSAKWVMDEASMELLERFKEIAGGSDWLFHEIDGVPTYQIDLHEQEEKLQQIAVELLKKVYLMEESQIEIDSFEV